MAKRSPPTPSFIGAIRPIIALVATAASIALPPFSRIDTPTCDASTASLATTPFFETIIERDCERSCAAAPDTTARHRLAPSAVRSLSIKILRSSGVMAATIAVPSLPVERCALVSKTLCLLYFVRVRSGRFSVHERRPVDQISRSADSARAPQTCHRREEPGQRSGGHEQQRAHGCDPKRGLDDQFRQFAKPQPTSGRVFRDARSPS